ncbi:TetR/AcrR family transcriptional regulator [Rhodococcus zopfii]|uniref:TetR/AcrR family transcriptional regulator n=1 Tax=Rhodococcus zopfii TaxID=43772 RepID=A0ABU3WPP5_9NOCA|nr:TetR/AcrR family transcriptional regulator [Rhodococcus zopfii]
MSDKPRQLRGTAVRDRLIDIATELFYVNGVRAVGIDEVIRRSGISKASLYRWFPSKGDLVVAALQRRDDLFWTAWDAVARENPDPRDELVAQLSWMRDLATSAGYRGCVFVNTAAEFDSDQSRIRERCLEHEEELRRRLRGLTARLGVADGDRLADRIHVVIVGAFAVGGVYPAGGPAGQLLDLVDVLVRAAVSASSPIA